MKSLSLHLLMLCVLFLNAFNLSAQSDFSGIWTLDHAKSDAEFRDYQMTCIITQTPKTFTVDQVLVTKDGVKSQMPSVSYNPDGKEVIKEEQSGNSRLLAFWATEDHKTLTIKYVRNIDGNKAGSITTYKLSDNDQLLTIKSSDLTGDSPMIQVYSKK
jgi:hypothetical protein